MEPLRLGVPALGVVELGQVVEARGGVRAGRLNPSASWSARFILDLSAAADEMVDRGYSASGQSAIRQVSRANDGSRPKGVTRPTPCAISSRHADR